MKKIWLGFLLIFSPWLLQLVFLLLKGRWEWGNWNPENFLSNISEYLSVDFFFLHGDSKIIFSTGETGLFQLSLLSLLAIGIRVETKIRKFLFLWFTTGLTVAALFGERAFFWGAVLFVIPLEIFIYMGGEKILSELNVADGLKKSIIGVLGFWLIYESVVFWHIFLVHYPQTLINAGIN